MTDLRVIGIDPGPTPGIVRLHYQNGRLVERWTHVVQCNSKVVPEILLTFIANGRQEWPRTLVQVERFVVGRRAGRSSSAHAGAVTRDLVGALEAVTGDLAAFTQQNASRVKAWSSNERLDAAGLLEATEGMRHARDAARHALFCAVHDGGIPDPLSKHQPNQED